MRWKVKDPYTKHKWFAWYPVKAIVNENGPLIESWGWLETIYRERFVFSYKYTRY